jgi:2'-5' RNA ligase
MNMNADTSYLRLFFALPADGIQEPLDDVYRYIKKFDQVKIVSPGNFHITLKFLGNTRYDIFEKLRDDFTRISFSVPPLIFNLNGLGGFPNVRRARVIWCGLMGNVTGVASINRDIEDLAERHGFKKETRGFAPHITLARVRNNERLPEDLIQYLEDNGDTLYGKVQFNRLVLFKSELRKGGPVYSAMSEKRL